MYTLVFVFGCKIRKFYWNRNDLTPTFLRFCGNTSGEEINTLLRKRLRKYAHRYLLLCTQKAQRSQKFKVESVRENDNLNTDSPDWTDSPWILKSLGNHPWNPVNPWSNYIHNGINGKRNGITEMDTNSNRNFFRPRTQRTKGFNV